MLNDIAEKVEGRGTTMTATKTKTKTTTKPTTGTVRLIRVFKAPREREFNAFLDPDAFAKWIPPNGNTAHVCKFEPKVRGTYRMSFSGREKADTQLVGGKCVGITPYARLG